MAIGSKKLPRAINAAIREGDAAKVEELIGGSSEVLNMSNPLGSWLHIAARTGQVEVAKKLVELGIDVNSTGGAAGGNALNIAASEGHLELVKFLINRGANLDVSKPERNPLFAAIHNGHFDVARILIDSGIDTSVKYTGETMVEMDAVAFADEWGRTEIKTLLEDNA